MTIQDYRDATEKFNHFSQVCLYLRLERAANQRGVPVQVVIDEYNEYVTRLKKAAQDYADAMREYIDGLRQNMRRI